ncbi:MAG: cellulase family glycosylhydrolase [Fimbriimonas sp.]
MLPAICLMLLAQRPAMNTPYSQQSPLALKSVSVITQPAIAMHPVELRVDWSGTFGNPFDPADAALDAVITPPSGARYSIPGFFYVPQSRELKDGKEVVTRAGDPDWRVRFLPKEAGDYSIVVTVRDRSGSQSKKITVPIKPGSGAGLVRISKRDPRYLEMENGHPFFPIGANVCWGGDRGTYNFDEWFPSYGKAKANYSRLWLSPFWSTFALESKASGVGQIDQAGAWKLDYTVDLAQKNGLFLMICFDSYNILRPRDAYNAWEETPHNQDNGGPLRIWSDFWTNPEMDRIYRNKLRYIVARYAAYPTVMAWEFWNEVDLTGDYKTDVVRDWHQRMARTLRTMDPYRHLITTSFSGSAGDKAIDNLPEMDYTQTHHYGIDPVQAIVSQQYKKVLYGKPHYAGEIGADWRGPDNDPDGVQIHDPIWASIATGSAGTGMSWWWDSLIAPKNLYFHYTAAAKFVAGVDFGGEQFRPSPTTISLAAAARTGQRFDLDLEPMVASWEASDANRPRTLRLAASGPIPSTQVPGIQHGLVNHPKLHNPLTLIIDSPRATPLDIIVGEVSGYGGAALRVTMDGKQVVSKDFPDNDPSNETLTKYAGTIRVTVPAGVHRVVIENTGNDWFKVTYRLPKFAQQAPTPIKAWAICGNTTALVWLRQANRTWQRATSGEKVPTMPASVLRLGGLSQGTWTATFWDTYTGETTGSLRLKVGLDGLGRIRIPSFQKDTAVKLRKES